MTEPKIEIRPNDQSTLSFEIAKKTQTKDLNLAQIFELSGELAYFDTGFMPQKRSGLINYRRGGGFETFVYQVDAGIHTVLWGARESSESVDRLKLAMPYRIIIGDHALDGNGYWSMVGARHFYSPVPIRSWDAPLYNCNVPNLNCQGYSATGVGWICLYHQKPYALKPMYERIMATVQRTSGNEAYNDANMDETDGPRYYEQQGKPDYFWNKQLWAKKSKEEGYEWTLNPELLLPVMIGDPAKEQMDRNFGDRHTSLFDLARGMYRAYYSDEIAIKPVNLMEQDNPFLKEYNKKDMIATYTHVRKLFDSNILSVPTKRVHNWVPKIEKKKCQISGKSFPETDDFFKFYDKDSKEGWAHPSSMKHTVGAIMMSPLIAGGKTPVSIKALRDAVWVDVDGRSLHVSVEKGPACPKCEKPTPPPGISGSVATMKEYGVCRNCLDRFNCNGCGRTHTIDYRAKRKIEDLNAINVSQKQKNMVIKAVQSGVNFRDIKIDITRGDENSQTTPDPNLCISCSRKKGPALCACGVECSNEIRNSNTQRVAGVYAPVCNDCVSIDPKSKAPIYVPKHVKHSYGLSQVKISNWKMSDITKVTGI